MFECAVPDSADLPGLDDAGVVDALREVTRAENALCARKLAAMAELFGRRTGCADAAERDSWWLDPDAAVAAEIGAATGISQGLAMSQTHRGVALRDRLPAVATLFAAGAISDLLVRTIVWRTALVESPAAMAPGSAAGRAGRPLGCVVGEENRGGHRRAGRSDRPRRAAPQPHRGHP